MNVKSASVVRIGTACARAYVAMSRSRDLDGGTSSPEEEPELSRLLPQVRRLRQLMATVQQGKYPPAVGSRAETASELGDHRPADRHLVGLEEPVDDVR